MAMSPGTRLGPYEILSPIGAGGMGEVYKAKDLKLGRDIAIKVLPQEMAADSNHLRRFEQEARAASALNHPNIITIYEIGEHEGAPYIAMEYVNGVTLREMLAGGPLPNDKLIRYANQMAEGLAKAHQAGIVHRDLKPENIVISEDGYVKILDFGLAKLMPTQEDSETRTIDQVMTEEGVIVGTLLYMSPEQAAGRSVDFRSDQFAMGSILYEVTTGQRPFERATAAETLTAIIREEPGAVADHVPTSVTRVIDRCLRKEPNDRYDSTGDIAKDLRWQSSPVAPSRRRLLAVVAAVVTILAVIYWGFVSNSTLEDEAGFPKIESIAVLPLENLSGDPEQDYFVDGMTDELIVELAQISALKVISRTSVMRYAGTRSRSLPEIAEELGVAALVEGSVRRAGERIRVNVLLFHAPTERQLWAQSFDRDLSDVLTLQSELARAIAENIQVSLSPAEEMRLARSRPVNPEAHDAYLNGMFHSQKLTPQALDAALSYFELALEKDPDYALGYTGIGRVWAFRRQMMYVPGREATPIEKAAVLKALELDESLAEAHSALAMLKTWGEWDWPSAERAFERALELNPNYAEARAYYSHLLNMVGRPDEAMSQIERALELDPFNPFYQFLYGMDLFFVRRYDDAIAEFRKALTTSPNMPGTLHALGNALHLTGMHEEALDAQKAYFSALGDDESQEALTQGYAEGGYAEAMRRAAETFAARSLTTDTGATYVAQLYARGGEKEPALEWLARAFANHHPGMPYLGLPIFDSLRDDPRFQDLLRRMNFPE